MGSKDDKRAMLRIVDANLNRAAEAARVVEDYARFVLDHAGLAHMAKSLRHRMRAAVDAMGADARQLLDARDTSGDVGTGISVDAERRRADLADVVRANFTRLEQALRVLEEYAKVAEGASGADAAFERMRYDAYILEKMMSDPPERPAVLEDKRLMVLVGGASPDETIALTEKVLAGGCRLIQLREKSMTDGACLSLARTLREMTARVGAVLIVNDRVDVAKASGADGVHLGLDDLPIEDARRILGPSKLIGLTAHTIDELTDAESRGPDYIGVGTMFPSPTKPDLEVRGPAALIPAAAKCSVPTYAIGGITRGNIDQLLKAGATRVAIASAITGASDVAAETKWFVQRMTS